MKALDEVMGRDFVFKKDNSNVRFLSYKIKGEEVTIVTDREWFVKHKSEILLFLDWFIPVGGVRNMGLAQVNKNQFEDVKSIIKNNIEKVQSDKSYIPQAMEVNNQIKSLIEIAKMEIDAFKVLKGA